MTRDADQPQVLRGATLITPHGPVGEGVVVIRDDRICQVGQGDEPVPAQGVVHDLTGHYLLPGLIDAHAHCVSRPVLRQLLESGITFIRDPAAAPENLPVDRRHGPGPDALRAGFPIDVPPSPFPGAVGVSSTQEMRQAVRQQIEDGRELIKLYVRLTPELVQAGVEEAHVQGARAQGDLLRTSWTEAARAGIDYLSHLPRHPDLLPEAARAAYLEEVQSGSPHALLLFYELVDLDASPIQEMIEALLEHGVVVDPTLTAMERVLFDHPAESSLFQRARQAWPRALELVSRLRWAGVTVIAGSDAPREGVVPGESLHSELAQLTRAGFSLPEAIGSATWRAAEALGLADRGLIVEEHRADLVVLSRDPLVDINNTRRIVWVMKDGQRV